MRIWGEYSSLPKQSKPGEAPSCSAKGLKPHISSLHTGFTFWLSRYWLGALCQCFPHISIQKRLGLDEALGVGSILLPEKLCQPGLFCIQRFGCIWGWTRQELPGAKNSALQTLREVPTQLSHPRELPASHFALVLSCYSTSCCVWNNPSHPNRPTNPSSPTPLLRSYKPGKVKSSKTSENHPKAP